MKIQEQYLGIHFHVTETGDSCLWQLEPPVGFVLPARGSGKVDGGQGEAILAARRAIGAYLNQKNTRPHRIDLHAKNAQL